MYKQLFEQHIQQFLESKNYAIKFQALYSEFADFHYQTGLLFALKKQLGNVNENELIEFMQATNAYDKVEITGKGFLSVKCKLVPSVVPPVKPQQKIIVDYCGVNVAKQMHIGHIRSMFIGDFIVRLHEQQNDEIIKFNHVGDWGNQFGYLLHYINSNHLQGSIDNKSLTQYYKAAYEQYQNDAVFAAQSDATAIKLQNYDPATIELWGKMVSISLQQAQITFDELDIKLDLDDTKGESFYAPMCKDVLQNLLQKNIATSQPDGSVVVFFEDKSPLILQKSNGNYLYALYDLAAIVYRATYKPNKIVYVVDKRQSLHFEQVFSVAYAAGFVPSTTQLLHVGFGTILGSDGKPIKTKEGKSLYLDDLLQEGKSILLQDTHFQNLPVEYQEEVLNKTIVGGMKFYDLKFDKNQDYIFDWKHVLNFTGGSAPYLQNAIVRIESIWCKKHGVQTPMMPTPYILQDLSPLAQSLLFNCQKTQELLQESDYASQALTKHAMKLCQLFHKMYESEKILNAPNESSMLSLLVQTSDTLKLLANVLGISWYPCLQVMQHSPKKYGKLTTK